MASLVVGLPWLRIWVFPELHPPFSRPGLPLDSPEKSLRLGFLRHWSPGGRGARPFRSVADRESARRRREDGAIQLPVCQVNISVPLPLSLRSFVMGIPGLMLCVCDFNTLQRATGKRRNDNSIPNLVKVEFLVRSNMFALLRCHFRVACKCLEKSTDILLQSDSEFVKDATELLKDGIDLVTYRQGSSEFVVLSSALYSSQC
uniref:Uncharacterized protein n=2 Tax=Musa acuminata subsp. malaccensis TaxID=214687 RepID=A0A804JB41_MUSAM